MSRNGPLALLFHGLVMVFMLAPILIVCVVAFTPEGYLSLPTNGLSLRWFKAIAGYPEFISAFGDSLWLAALSSVIAVGVSVPAALVVARHQFPGREALCALILSPLMIPHVVLGVAFLRFFTQIGVSGTKVSLVLAHVVIVLPFAFRLTLSTTTGMDRALEQAALSLGASGATLFRRVTLPLILPGVASGLVLAFINSFDEVTLSIFVTSPATQTLPVRMYVYATESIDPMMAAVSALMIALTAGAMLVLDRAFGLDKILVGAK